MLLRKLVDTDRNSVSLQNLVREMRDHADVLTRARHHDAARRGWQESGYTAGTDADCDALFDEMAGRGAPVIPRDLLQLPVWSVWSPSGFASGRQHFDPVDGWVAVRNTR